MEFSYEVPDGLLEEWAKDFMRKRLFRVYKIEHKKQKEVVPTADN